MDGWLAMPTFLKCSVTYKRFLPSWSMKQVAGSPAFSQDKVVALQAAVDLSLSFPLISFLKI
jgi:hypothetical protein